MNDKYYELYKNYKTDFSISEVEPILNFTNYNTLDFDNNSMNKDVLNKLAIVKLNGGLGTTMKCSKAKGCLEVIENKTFLDIFINQVICVNKKYSCSMPIVLMNSEYTETDTQVILDKYSKHIDIYCFNQEFLYRYYEEELDNDVVRLHSTRYPPETITL